MLLATERIEPKIELKFFLMKNFGLKARMLQCNENVQLSFEIFWVNEGKSGSR